MLAELFEVIFQLLNFTNANDRDALSTHTFGCGDTHSRTSFTGEVDRIKRTRELFDDRFVQLSENSAVVRLRNHQNVSLDLRCRRIRSRH